MGGFNLATGLGHAAAGFEQARQQDLQRQHDSEQSRRSQFMGMLQSLATNPNAHPYTQQQAIQMGVELAQTPGNKKYKFDPDRLIAPPGQQIQQPPAQTTQPGSQMQAPPTQTTLPPVPLPPGMSGPPSPGAQIDLPGATGSLPATTSQAAPPAPPPGMFMSPEQHAQVAQMQTAAQTRGQAGSEMKTPIYTKNPDGTFTVVGMSGTGEPMGAGIPNAISPYMMQGRGLRQITYLDPQNGKPLPGVHNLFTGEVLDQKGQVVPGAVPFESSLVPKTTTSSATTAGGLTSTSKKTVTPQLSNVPTQGGATAKPAGSGAASSSSSSRVIPPAVSAAMDNLMLYGMPEGKMNDAQALALQQMKKEGIDPQIAATMATRTMADKGRSILPLIDKARTLIAQDPGALGPLSGRWSEIQQKAGNLEGPAKELAGTLTSIYSMAGGMHGWRALKVADEFRKTYGDLSNTPKSLLDGLSAMEGTANSIIHTAYPGAKGGPPTPPQGTAPAFNWNDHPVITAPH